MFGLQLSRLGAAISAAYGYSPTSLFSSGEVGAWYDPSDLTTMFQDSAGTTPVTADGQPVGKILDKSGRGNHATQATAAKRPLYKTNGTEHWLQFDGVDDVVTTATNVDFTATDKMTIFSGARIAGTTNQNPVSVGSSGAGRANLVFLSGVSPYARSELDASSAGYMTTPSPGAAPVSVTNTVLLDIAGATTYDEIKLRQNGALGTQSPISGPAGTGNFASAPISVGDTNNISPVFPLNGNIYSMIVLGRTATTQEITDTETWVNSRTGAF